MFKFELGQKVTAPFFQIEGVVTAHTEYLNGSRQYTISRMGRTGEPREDSIQEHLVKPNKGETEAKIPYGFEYPLGAPVRIAHLKEIGTVTGAHRTWHGQTQYLVVYNANDQLREQWIEQSLLRLEK